MHNLKPAVVHGSHTTFRQLLFLLWCLSCLVLGAIAVPGDRRIANIEKKYAHFVDLLTGVLVIREGGLEEAFKALPRFLNQTRGHLAVRAAFKLKHPTKEAQKAANDELQEKLNQLNLKFSKLPPGFVDAVDQPKTSKEKVKMDKEQQIINNITAKSEKYVPQQALNDINNDLASSKANVQITPVSISPSQKFADNTAVLSNAITLLSGSISGINFSPCLVSINVAGIGVTIYGVDFQPHLIDIEPAVSSLQAYGINLQPTMLSVTPNGIQAAPGGVSVQPTLIAIAPTGASIQPMGLNIAPYLAQMGTVGFNSNPIGLQAGGN